MPEKTGKNLKLRLVGRLVGTTLLGVFVVLVVIVYFNTALGWFANNKNVSGTGMSVKVEAMDAEAEYFAYIYDIKKARVIYTGDQSISSEEEPRIDHLDMQFFDTIFTQRNSYTPAVIRIRLSSIKDQWTDGGIVKVEIGRNTSLEDLSVQNNVLSNYFSSVMRYTLAQNKLWYNASEASLYTTVNTALYDTVSGNDSNTNTVSSRTFTTVTSSVNPETEETGISITKTDTITLKVAYDAEDIVNGHLDVYLYITYDTSLMNSYEYQIGGIETTSSVIGSRTEMVNDMASLVVSFESTD